MKRYRKYLLRSLALLALIAFLVWVWPIVFYHTKVDRTWREEIILQNGQHVALERGVAFTYEHYTNMIHTFSLAEPLSGGLPTFPPWKGDDIPVLLDYDQQKKAWYLVATFNLFPSKYRELWKSYCPPYRLYRQKAQQWELVEFDHGLIGVETNLMGDAFMGSSSLIMPEDLTAYREHVRSVTHNGSRLIFAGGFYYIQITAECPRLNFNN